MSRRSIAATAFGSFSIGAWPTPGTVTSSAPRHDGGTTKFGPWTTSTPPVNASMGGRLPRSHAVRSGRAAALSAEQVAALCQQVPGTRVHASLGAFADHLLAIVNEARAGEFPATVHRKE